MDGQEMIAQKALLLVTDHVRLQHLFPALRARHYERHHEDSDGSARVHPSGFSAGFRRVVALGRLLDLGRLAQSLLELLHPDCACPLTLRAPRSGTAWRSGWWRRTPPPAR